MISNPLLLPGSRTPGTISRNASKFKIALGRPSQDQVLDMKTRYRRSHPMSLVERISPVESDILARNVDRDSYPFLDLDRRNNVHRLGWSASDNDKATGGLSPGDLVGTVLG